MATIDRETEDRKHSFEFSGSLLKIVLWLFVDSALVMLFLGNAHGGSPLIPAPGYWTVFWVLAALYTIVISIKKMAK